jgi:hypothetical protein
MNDLPHDRDEDATEYLAFIQRLADEFRISVERVLPLYEQELITLRSNARVTAYLSVLATKHVHDVLQEEMRRREQ